MYELGTKGIYHFSLAELDLDFQMITAGHQDYKIKCKILQNILQNCSL